MIERERERERREKKLLPFFPLFLNEQKNKPNPYNFFLYLPSSLPSFLPSGTYPALAFRLHLTRRLSYMLLQVYLPSGLFVVVSFVSLLVPAEAIPGRMTLCITTILTMSALLGVAMLVLLGSLDYPLTSSCLLLNHSCLLLVAPNTSWKK